MKRPKWLHRPKLSLTTKCVLLAIVLAFVTMAGAIPKEEAAKLSMILAGVITADKIRQGIISPSDLIIPPGAVPQPTDTTSTTDTAPETPAPDVPPTEPPTNEQSS